MPSDVKLNRVEPPTAEAPSATVRANWGDYACIAVAQALVLFAALVSYRLAKSLLGLDGFAEYALSRRTLSLLLPLTALGVNLALSRQLALHSGDEEREAPALLGAALLLCAGAGAVVAATAALCPRWLAYLLFGDASYAYLVPALIALAAGGTLHLICYGFLRGRSQFRAASLLEALSIGVAPLAAFAFFAKDARTVLTWTGLFSCFVCLLAILCICRFSPARLLGRGLGRRCSSLFSYGYQRIPGDFAWAAIFGLPPIFAAHYVGLQEAGLMAFGNTMLTLAGTAVAPINVVLLPESAKMLKSGELPQLRAHINRIQVLSLGAAVAATAAGELLMGVAMTWYLGKEFEQATFIPRILILGVPPCVLYTCLRSVVDAAHHRAINTVNQLIALAVIAALTFAGLWLWGGLLPILIGFLAGLYLLGFLTWLQTRRILERTGPEALRI